MTEAKAGTLASLSTSGVPPAVIQSLDLLRQQLESAAGDDFAGLVVYGGIARGKFRPDRSDVNVVVLLRDASRPSLEKIAPALREAWRTARVDPLIMTPDEVRQSADAFPTKFLHIQDYHFVLAGENPFASLQVSRNHIRMRVEQELRNLSLRLRRRYITAAGDGPALNAILREIAAPLAVTLRSLLWLSEKPLPDDSSTAAILGAAADAFSLDAGALKALAALRHETKVEEDPENLYGGVLSAVSRTADIADAMET